MTGAFPPKAVAAGEGKAAEYYQLADHYGITSQDDRIPGLERTYGVKL